MTTATQNSTGSGPWQEIVQTCILGSGRRESDISAAGSLGLLLDDCAASQASGGANREEKILAALASVSVAMRTGQLSLSAASLPEPPPECPVESDSLCSFRSVSMLNQILGDQAKGGDARRVRLLRDWLTFCHEGGKTVLPAHLPKMLELLKNLNELHELLAACGGQLLPWLLKQNSEWQLAYKDILPPEASGRALPETLVNQVEIGFDAERLQAFQKLRTIDPEAANRLLITLWEKESADQKLPLLRLLDIELSDFDEPFLEEIALADRRKEVRGTAITLLNKLPASRLATRMQERAAAMVNVKTTLLIKKELEINLPAQFDKSMARDGIDENITVDSRIGQKAGWLFQVLSQVNPAFWARHTGLTAEQFLDLIFASSEWSLPMVLGLLNATALYGDSQWQDAILNREEIHLTESQQGQTFLKNLPHQKLEALLLKKLPSWAKTDRKSAPRLDLWYYLELVDFQWSENFSLALVRFIIKEIREKVPVFGHTFYSNATNFGLRMHVAAAPLLNDVNLAYEEVDTWTRNGIERFIDNLKLRYEIKQSFLDGEEAEQ